MTGKIKGTVLPLLIGLVIFNVACEGMSSFKGRVLDSNKRPVADAKIVFEVSGVGERSEEVSDRDGHFYTIFLHSPYSGVTITITTSKEGYKTYEQKLAPGDYKNFEIILEKDSESAAK